MEEDKITLEQLRDPAFRRGMQMKVRSEIIWVAFMEMDGLVNFTQFAKRFFGKSHSWFSQKLHGLTVKGIKKGFTEDEYRIFAASFRKMAAKLNEYADALDNAEE